MVFNVFGKKPQIYSGLEISPEGFTIVSISCENGKYLLKDFYTETFDEEIYKNGLQIA